MTPRPLDVEVTRKGRPVEGARWQLTADVDDYPALQATLRNWLSGNKWSGAKWGQFELKVRFAGEGKVRSTVRAV